MALISTKLKCLLNGVNIARQKQVLQLIKPCYYHSSLFREDVGDVNTKYEVTSDLKDWKFVERALAPTLIPNPIEKEKYPSGWTPQANDLRNRPFFVERTKNHMIPVYLLIRQRGTVRITKIKKIQGDIWQFDKELFEFLQKQSFQPIRRQVNEFNGTILINGDHVNAIKYWLEERNY